MASVVVLCIVYFEKSTQEAYIFYKLDHYCRVSFLMYVYIIFSHQPYIYKGKSFYRFYICICKCFTYLYVAKCNIIIILCIQICSLFLTSLFVSVRDRFWNDTTMGRRGNLFSSIKKAFSPESKEKRRQVLSNSIFNISFVDFRLFFNFFNCNFRKQIDQMIKGSRRKNL